MLVARLGSLNALEQNREFPFWKAFLDGKPPSADSNGRIMNLVAVGDLRGVMKEIYARIRRNRVALLTIGGMCVLVLDGHESHASVKQKCAGCLERTVRNSKGEHKEYYHRHVLAILLMPWGCLHLDAEAQKPGEDEVAAAIRLMERILENYPRAFDIVVADALYVRGPFFNFILKRGKHVMAVLKNEERHLYRDAERLLPFSPSEPLFGIPVSGTVWDIEHLETWDGVTTPVRVIHSVEERKVKRQRTKKVEVERSSWWWVTTAPATLLPVIAAWFIGHARWRIENQGFNEAVNHWHVDHVYKHKPNAMLGFLLLTCMTWNLFHVFYHRNIKPPLRRRFSKLHIAREIMSELFLRHSPSPVSLPP